MEKLKDIKSVLLKNQKKEINNEETFVEISYLINRDGYYSSNDIKRAYELGKTDTENDITSNDNILDVIGDDLDEFVNFISINGFFSKEDIDMWYKVGSNNKESDTSSDTVKEICMKAFNMYLILNWD